jgi:hypothetical protein
MNLMTLQRYKNELILLITLLFVLGAFMYKLSATTYVTENKSSIQKHISEIITIENYKKQWKSKGMANKVKVFKSIVNATKVKTFSKKSSKLTLSYINLTANELNKITNKLLNLPVQIMTLQIQERGKNKFTMELTCKW